MGGSWKRRPGRQLGGKGRADLTFMWKSLDACVRTHHWSFTNREGLAWSVCVLMLRREGREGPGRKLLY